MERIQLKKRLMLILSCFTLFLLMISPLIPAIESIEKKEEIEKQQRDIRSSFLSILNNYSLSENQIKYILAILLYPISLILSLPGLFIRLYSYTCLLHLKIINFYLWNYLGLLLSYPLLISRCIINTRGYFNMFENFQNYFDYLSDRIIPDIIYNMGVTLGAMLIFTYFTINTFFIFPLETIYEEFSDDGYLRQMMGDLFYYVVLFPANMIPDTILVILQLAVYSGFFILNMTFREIFFRLIILIFIIIPCNIILLIKNFINPDKLSENCGNFNVSTQPYRFSFNVSAF